MSSIKSSWVDLLARRCARAEEMASGAHPPTDNANPANDPAPTPSRFRIPSPDPYLAVFDSMPMSLRRDFEQLNLQTYPAPRDMNNADTVIAARKTRQESQARLRARNTLPMSPRSVLYRDENYCAIKSKELGIIGRRIRKLPTEIRIMIFTECLHEDKHPDGIQGAANFLSAFRASPKLYKEALELYYKFNVISLKANDIDLFLGLKADIIPLVKNLRICINATRAEDWIFNFSNHKSRWQLVQALEVKHLEITTNFRTSLVTQIVVYGRTTLFPKLTFFSIKFIEEDDDSDYDSDDDDLEPLVLGTITRETGMKLEPWKDLSEGDVKLNPWNRVWRK